MRGSLRVLVSASAAALVGLGALTGCSGGDAPAAESGTTSSSGSTTGEATASASATAVGLPADSTWATAPRSGLRFAVPDTWTPVSAETLAGSADSDSVKALLESMQVTKEELLASMAGMDVLVMGPAEKNFGPNVNAVPNSLTELPPSNSFAAELTKLGATTGTPREVSTALGPAIVVPYTLPNGDTTIVGRSIVVGGPNGFVTITVSHVDNKAADAVADTLLSTLGAT